MIREGRRRRHPHPYGARRPVGAGEDRGRASREIALHLLPRILSGVRRVFGEDLEPLPLFAREGLLGQAREEGRRLPGRIARRERDRERVQHVRELRRRARLVGPVARVPHVPAVGPQAMRVESDALLEPRELVVERLGGHGVRASFRVGVERQDRPHEVAVVPPFGEVSALELLPVRGNDLLIPHLLGHRPEIGGARVVAFGGDAGEGHRAEEAGVVVGDGLIVHVALLLEPRGPRHEAVHRVLPQRLIHPRDAVEPVVRDGAQPAVRADAVAVVVMHDRVAALPVEHLQLVVEHRAEVADGRSRVLRLLGDAMADGEGEGGVPPVPGLVAGVDGVLRGRVAGLGKLLPRRRAGLLHPREHREALLREEDARVRAERVIRGVERAGDDGGGALGERRVLRARPLFATIAPVAGDEEQGDGQESAEKPGGPPPRPSPRKSGGRVTLRPEVTGHWRSLRGRCDGNVSVNASRKRGRQDLAVYRHPPPAPRGEGRGGGRHPVPLMRL